MTWPGANDVPGRVRRPADAALLVLIVVLLALVLGFSAGAASTTGALERDLSLAVSGLPGVILSIIGFAGGVGAVLLPVALGLDLARRGRLLLLVEAIAAAGIGAAVAAGIEWLVSGGHIPRDLANALTRPVSGAGRTNPMSEIVVATTALLSSSTGSPRIQRPGIVIVAAVALTSLLGGDATAVALVTSVLVGLLIGVALRVALGRPTTRATPAQVAQALAKVGVVSGPLEQQPTRRDGVRRYSAADGTMRVDVFDRDALGSGLLSAWCDWSRCGRAEREPPS